MSGLVNNMSSYSVLIPTYNEKDNVCVLARRLFDVFENKIPGSKYEIVIIDDNSPDGTWKIASEEFAQDSRVKVIRRMKDPGLSQSIVEGFENANGDVMAVMDADLEHDESCLSSIFELAKNCDIVLGTRFSDGGSIEGGWPLSRRLMSFVANSMARIILGTKISDPMSGFFAIRKSAYEKIRGKLDPRGFKILLEVFFTLRCVCPDAKFAEKGIRFRKRSAGESKMGLKVIFEYLKSLIKLRARKKELEA